MAKLNKEYVERIEKAEDILNGLYWDIRDEKGMKQIAKKLDTILGKLYNLKYTN